MTGVIATKPPAGDIVALAEQAETYAQASRAAETLRGYRSDWRQFRRWCDDRGVEPLPAAPEVVVGYLTDRAGVLAVGTLQRHLTSIAQAHTGVGHESPTRSESVRQVWKGIRRTFGTASRGKAPLLTADVRAMVANLDPARPIDVRDRALVLLGFAGALRRSELVALNVDDVEETDDGLLVTIRRSKTDQEGRGHVLGVPYGSDRGTCPVRAVRAHLAASGISEGPLFRVMRTGRRMSGQAAAERVKRLAELIGRDPAEIGAHSLRAGLITSAVAADVHERDVMRHSRHRSVHVFRSYIRGLEAFDRNAAAAVGL